MRKKSKLKRTLFFLLALMMTSSPLFLSGCFGSSNTGSTTTNVQQTTPSTSGGGGGGTSNNNSNSNLNNNQENRRSLEYEEYDQYFKNYRVTYQTSNTNRNSFNKEIYKQNNELSSSIASSLNSSYGSSAMFSTVDYNIANIPTGSGENNHLLYSSESNYYVTQYTHDGSDYLQYFTHAASINISANRLKIATTLILQGYNAVDENGSKNNEFETQYNSLCSSLLNTDGTAKNDSQFEETLTNLSNGITHLGFTDRDLEQIENFILHYVIGTSNVNSDNALFANCYYENGAVYVKYYANGSSSQRSSAFNKFLTDETYATGYLDDTQQTLQFGLKSDLSGAGDKRLQGLLYYAGNYLASVKSTSQSFITNSLVVDAYDGAYSFLDNAYTESNTYSANTDCPNLTSAIYNKLIKIDSVRNSFNANIWNYDENGVENSENAGNFVIDDAGHVLFSVRLPGFKNYVNTVHKIVSSETSKAPSQTELNSWLLTHGYEYPYKDAETDSYIKYPNIPYTYFADYDNGDMLFDGESGAARMFSGFKLYQNLVLMPQSDVDVESGALFVVRKLVEDETHYADGSTDHSGDFEMTVYLRYYDAATQSYATWTDEETGAITQFYKIGTETIDYNMYYTEDIDEEALENAETDEEIENATSFKANYAPVTFDFSIKEILLSAQVNGSDNESWTLEAFDDGKELCLHNQELVTKDNYGECFREDYTPEGDKVVVYDGKSVGSSSYMELVFYCSRAVPFQFCFYPTVAYAPQS